MLLASCHTLGFWYWTNAIIRTQTSGAGPSPEWWSSIIMSQHTPLFFIKWVCLRYFITVRECSQTHWDGMCSDRHLHPSSPVSVVLLFYLLREEAEWLKGKTQSEWRSGNVIWRALNGAKFIIQKKTWAGLSYLDAQSIKTVMTPCYVQKQNIIQLYQATMNVRSPWHFYSLMLYSEMSIIKFILKTILVPHFISLLIIGLLIV